MMTKLTAKKVKNALPRKKEYKLHDGGGLFLRIRPSGAKSWLFSFSLPNDRRLIRMTLGSLKDISLKEARAKLPELHDQVSQGIDPRHARAAKQNKNTNNKHDIFISYAKEDTEIVENLRGQFGVYGIKAWVYKKDSIVTEEVWREIESKILETGLFLYVASQFSNNAAGQKRELIFALDKIAKFKSSKIMSLVLPGIDFNQIPGKLSKYTGRYLDINNIKSEAYNIAITIFPTIVEKSISEHWKYPVPGDWLRVSNIDKFIGNDVAVGDKLYFRTLSPLGLFECYSPKLQDKYWIAPENVSISLDFENDKQSELDIPEEYKVSTMFDMMLTGWNYMKIIEAKNRFRKTVK